MSKQLIKQEIASLVIESTFYDDIKEPMFFTLHPSPSLFFGFFLLFFFFATPVICGPSRARDQTHTTAAPDPQQ